MGAPSNGFKGVFMLSLLIKQIQFFVKNKIYMFGLICSAVLGYGYEIFHGTCGIDDLAMDTYFEKGLGVVTGRWPFYLINKVVPIEPYKPVVMDLLTVLLLMMAAILWCVIIRSVLNKEVPIIAYVIFSAIFLDYSLISRIFVYYLQNGLGILSVLAAIAIYICWYRFSNKLSWEKRFYYTAVSVILLTLAICFYESAASIFLLGAIWSLYADACSANKIQANKGIRFFQYIWYVVRVLLYSIILRSVITSFLVEQLELKSYYYFRSALDFSWIYKDGLWGLYSGLVELFKKIVRDYFVMGVATYPIALFALATFVFAAFLVIDLCREKNWLRFFLGLLSYASIYAMSLVLGTTVEYRACQTFSIFIGLVLFDLVLRLQREKKEIRYCGYGIISIMILLSVARLNRDFYVNYRNDQMEHEVVQQIAEELQSGKYDIENKKVVFVGEYQLDEDLIDEFYISEGEFGWPLVGWCQEWLGFPKQTEFCFAVDLQNSVINWGIEGLAIYDGYNTQIHKLFEYCGYSFLWGSSEDYVSLMPCYYDYVPEYEYQKKIRYDKSSAYPNQGYIEELDDYIVVKF